MPGPWDLTVMCGDQRLAADSSDGRMIPSDLRFSTTAQGGPQTLECGLLRHVGDVGHERPFDPLRVIAPHGQVPWDGRLANVARTVTGHTAQRSPQGVGLAAMLEDRQDVRFLGIDRDLARWRSPTLNRQVYLNGLPLRLQEHAVKDGALALNIPGYTWTTSVGRPLVEATYDAGPLQIKSMVGHWKVTGSLPSPAAAWIFWSYEASDVDITTATAVSSNYLSGGTEADFSAGPLGASCRTVGFQFYCNQAPGETAEGYWEVALSNLAVVGDHGLPLIGSGPANYGLKASDAISHLIQTYCPQIALGNVADSGVPLQHLAYLEPQTLGQILGAINAHHAWFWAIRDGQFDYHPFGEGASKTWYVRAGDPDVSLSQEGDDGAALWTDIVVSYTTPSGELRTVGGPGTLADAFDASLAITDPDHPGIAAGVRRVYHFAMDTPTVQVTAISVGQIMLAQLNAARRAGSVSIKGMVSDSAGVAWPCYMVRGGDQIVITDIGDSTPRQVASTNYTHSSLTVEAAVDNALQTVEAIVSHLGGRTVGVG
jgi:hypothetical protein